MGASAANWIKTDGGRGDWLRSGQAPGRLPSRAGDCVTRALALLLGPQHGYGTVWSEISRLKLTMATCNRKNADYGATIAQSQRLVRNLTSGNLVSRKLPRRRKLATWVAENPNFVGIARTGHHFTMVAHGKFYDEWDSSRKQITEVLSLKGVIEFQEPVPAVAAVSPDVKPVKKSSKAERNAHIVQMHKNGVKLNEIGERSGLSRSGVWCVLRKEGLV